MPVASSIYADLLLPLPLPRFFTYRVPPELEETCSAGKRVVVQFGKKKLYTGIVHNTHTIKPQGYECKDVLSVLDAIPVIEAGQIDFWQWIADYYMCSIGEVSKAALPSGLRLESETRILYNPKFTDGHLLNARETAVMDIMEQRNALTIQELITESEQAGIFAVVKTLAEKKALFVEEVLREKYKPKTEKYVKLTDRILDNNELPELMNQLARAPKQLKVLMTYLQISGHFDANSEGREITQKELAQKSEATPSLIKALADKGVLEVYEKNIDRLTAEIAGRKHMKDLSDAQQKAYDAIRESFTTHDVTLLHGVTSSGKTEVYIQLIQEQLKQGKQVLYLLPEIALTTQIITRLRNVFGDKTGIYHSKFNDAERVEIWQKMRTDENSYEIILGVRSSVFLPFTRLGLVIVDEEHENTYKQYDPAPRYHARDAAIVLATMCKAKVLLGTATPSIETYYNAKQGKFGLVELFSRYGDVQLPLVQLADVRQAERKKQMTSHFTPKLIGALQKTLDNKEQAILFQNRRGFSPYIECKTCGWIPRCEHCDVSLTYHKHINQVVCHYCGFSYQTPKKCFACSDTAIQTKGFGTEKIEDELSVIFPQANIARMDLDTTRAKRAYETIIGEFEAGNIDILIGTQMVSKGLDFDKVSLVGILNADSMLNYPDFRAFERSFQLMAQVSGRAGRKQKQGLVVVQTMAVDHWVLKDVIANDYTHLFNAQLAEREAFNYPPFTRLIRIVIKHKDEQTTFRSATELANRMRQSFGHRVLGPEPPLVSRIQNRYLQAIVLKIEKPKSMSKAKQLLLEHIESIKEAFSNLLIICDVDPV